MTATRVGHFPVRNHWPTFTVGVDFDGCLAPDSHAVTFGPPSLMLRESMLRWKRQGARVIVASARPVTYHDEIRAWLDLHQVPYDQVVLGARPPVDVMVDDRGLLPPAFALDTFVHWVWNGKDPTAWVGGADEGMLSAEMAGVPENPASPSHGHDPYFHVAVLHSGGVDSTVAWLMALEAGLPARRFYVDTGSAYSKHELAAITQLEAEVRRCGLDPGDLIVLDLGDVPYQRFAHIDRARNGLILFTVAEHMRRGGMWGEVWLSNVAWWLEGPVWGGDKSYRALLGMQQLLTLAGYDLRLACPVGALSKLDLAQWAVGHGFGGVLDATFSCFAPSDAGVPCGCCRACFKRWLALEAVGRNDVAAWGETALDLAGQAKELADRSAAAHPWEVDWAPSRVRDALRLAERWLA